MKTITLKNGICLVGKGKDIVNALANLAKEYPTIAELIQSRLH